MPGHSAEDVIWRTCGLQLGEIRERLSVWTPKWVQDPRGMTLGCFWEAFWGAFWMIFACVLGGCRAQRAEFEAPCPYKERERERQKEIYE